MPAIERAADEFIASRDNLKLDREQLAADEEKLITAMEKAGKTSYQREVKPGDVLKIKISKSKKRASVKHTQAK